MAGIWSGFQDSITGGGGAPGSPLPREAIPELTANMLNNFRMAQMLAQQTQTRAGDQFSTQQNMLPFILSQLGIGSDRLSNEGGGYQLGNFRYEGTDALRGLDDMARLGAGSLPQQYANMGYSLDANGNPVENADSQRNQFLDASGRRVTDAEQLYERANADLLRSQGTSEEALAATRRQLQTAEGLQAPTLDRLGISRDASGNFVNDPNSRMGQMDAQLLQQMYTGRDLQMAQLAQMGFVQGPNGMTFDPNSAAGRTQQSFQDLIRQSQGQLTAAQGEVGTSQQLRDAELGRLGMTQDASGNWINDTNSNEMRMRGLQGDFLTRAKMGMEGTAPINPGLHRQIADEERQLREQLVRQLGPGYETTSPGMEALANFQKRRSELTYMEQQDAMSLGVNQAIGLQGSNLNTLAALYGVSEPVLRAMMNSSNALGAATNVSSAATNAANQTNATNASVMGQLQQNVLNPITAQSNVNAQTLAALYGLTAPALAASGQLGAQNIANQTSAMNAYGQMANLGTARGAAINDRATGGLNFQNANAALLASIPSQQQALYMNTNNARMGNLAALYPALQSGFDQSQFMNLAQLYGNLGSASGGQSQEFGNQIMSGDQAHFQTNINNLFWQNLMRSGGQFVGSGMGYGGPNARGGAGGGGGGGMGMVG